MAPTRTGPRVALSERTQAAWGIDEAFIVGLLRGAPAGSAAAVLRRMPGRVTYRLAVPSGRSVVVKHSAGASGGLAGLVRGLRTVVGRAEAASPSQREFEALTALRDLGVPVPEPLGWAAERDRERSLGVVVMALVPHAESLRQRLARAPADAARFAPELAALAARLHGAGWYHRDFYLEHVVVETATERLVLLDLARARQERAPRRRWFVKDLGALASTPDVDEVARCRFLDAYCDQRAIAPGERRDWARAILARARRIARHEPRYADAETREGGL